MEAVAEAATLGKAASFNDSLGLQDWGSYAQNFGSYRKQTFFLYKTLHLQYSCNHELLEISLKLTVCCGGCG